MSEQLRKYINEWNEAQSSSKHGMYNFDRFDKELKSLQSAIRSLYEEEESTLTEEERREVDEILCVDLTEFG